jgi:hypothetical protein
VSCTVHFSDVLLSQTTRWVGVFHYYRCCRSSICRYRLQESRNFRDLSPTKKKNIIENDKLFRIRKVQKFTKWSAFVHVLSSWGKCSSLSALGCSIWRVLFYFEGAQRKKQFQFGFHFASRTKLKFLYLLNCFEYEAGKVERKEKRLCTAHISWFILLLGTTIWFRCPCLVLNNNTARGDRRSTLSLALTVPWD